MPGADRNFDLLRGCQLDALPLDHFVEAIVVFERIHAGDIIVVGILEAPDDAAALIDFPLDSFEPNADLDVLDLAALQIGDRLCHLRYF